MNKFSWTMPILFTKSVGKKPISITYRNGHYVVWKTEQGEYLLSDAACPHRGANLAQGKVVGENLHCCFHGWQIAPDGRLWNPAQQRHKGCIPIIKLQNRYDLLWVVTPDVPIPDLVALGQSYMGSIIVPFSAPLHTTVDTFCDISHIPYVHALPGPTPDEFKKIVYEVKIGDRDIVAKASVPQKYFSLLTIFFGFFKTQWNIKTKVSFNPIRVEYEMFWHRKNSQYPLSGIIKNFYFFYPKNNKETVSIGILSTSLPWYAKPIGLFVAPWVRLLTTHLLREDQKILEQMLSTKSNLKDYVLDEYDVMLQKINQKLEESKECNL